MRKAGAYSVVAGVIAFAVVSVAVYAAAPKTLVFNGTQVPNAVVEMNGRTYVDLQELARATNGTIENQDEQISFNLPPEPVAQAIISPDFARLSVDALAAMREWQGAVEAALATGVSGAVANLYWMEPYKAQAESALNTASLSASTEADRQVLGLLQNESSNLQDWINQAIAQRQNLNATNTVAENAFQNDPALARISECAASLTGMLLNRRTAEDSVCRQP